MYLAATMVSYRKIGIQCKYYSSPFRQCRLVRPLLTKGTILEKPSPTLFALIFFSGLCLATIDNKSDLRVNNEMSKCAWGAGMRLKISA